MKDQDIIIKDSQIVSLVSGKGGSGKTSITIALAYILKEVGLDVLIVDFDFSTNGASYFFKYSIKSKKKVNGLEGILKHKSNTNEKNESYSSLIEENTFVVENGFSFIPSRINFDTDLNVAENISSYSNKLEAIAKEICKNASSKYDIVLFDNQAGANNTSKISSRVSQKVVIVSELDPISNDAVDSLLIQIGDSFPSYRRHLINKLHIDESKEYKDIDVLFQSFNRLPPLPFDLKIRAAFSSRKIPLSNSTISTFSVALLNTIKSLFPEFEENIYSYENKIRSKYDQFKEKMDELIDRRNKLIEELETKKSSKNSIFGNYLQIIGFIGSITAITISFSTTLFDKFLTNELFSSKEFTIYLMSAISISFIATLIANQYFRSKREVRSTKDIMTEIEKINAEIDNYKSFLMTRSGSYILDYIK